MRSAAAMPLQIARRALELVCMGCLAALVLVTSVDVVGRYAFGAPLASAFSIARVLMGVMVFAALPLASAADEHLRAGLFDAKWSSAGLKLRAIVVPAVSALACAVLAWRLGAQAAEYAANGELIEIIDLRASWVAGLLSGLAGAASLTCLALFIRALAARSSVEAPSDPTGASP